jgi:Protein of unknown function (DUF3500)
MKPARSLLAIGAAAALLGAVAASEKSSATMASAADRLLGALSPEQRQQAAFAFDAAERTNWHYIPRERKGLPLKQMNEEQRKLARELLRSGLSQRGYLTATSIMDLETILGDLEQRTNSPERRIVRDPELYFFSVFGTPSGREAWGWRVEGHHISLNFTVANGTAVASTPSFFGTNPAEVPEGTKKGMRILAQEEDAGRALLLAFDEARRAKATINATAPNDIVTTNSVKIDPLAPPGVTAAEMTPAQRDLLMKLIDVYTSSMAGDVAADRMARIRKAGVEKIAFAWAGASEHGKKHYYRVQGPTFLVEYDNTQNDANHIHSVWREFDGDFGRDILREHVKSVAH